MPQPNLETELNDAQRDEVDGWILSGTNYTDIIARLEERSWPSRGLSSWTGYKRRAESRAVQKAIFNGNQFRAQIDELKKGTGDELLQSQLHLLGQIALQLAVNGTADPAQLKLAQRLTALTLEAEGMKGKAALEEKKIAQKQEQIDLDRDRFELLKAKAEQADAAKRTTEDESLTPEQKQQKLRQIFGMT